MQTKTKKEPIVRKKQKNPKKSMLDGKLAEILQQLSLGVTITKVAKHFGCTRQNLYIFLEKKGISDPRNIPETFFVPDGEDFIVDSAQVEMFGDDGSEKDAVAGKIKEKAMTQDEALDMIAGDLDLVIEIDEKSSKEELQVELDRLNNLKSKIHAFSLKVDDMIIDIKRSIAKLTKD